MKVRGADTKWLLRRVLYRHVPRELVDRPKMGFGVPIGSWLRGPLKSWARDLLDRDRLARQGFLNADLVDRTLEDHLSGKQDNQYLLWDVLMFQSWLDGQRV
jgi:asparagine synthase (glutamine-hydrolysing)